MCCARNQRHRKQINLSIQNRLLIIYTSIFSFAFLIIALIVYNLPRNRILVEIDNDLATLASEVVPGNISVTSSGLSIPIPNDLAYFETVSTFMLIVDAEGFIVAQSENLAGFEGYLDESAFINEFETYNQVTFGETSLRVLTVPIANGDGEILGYLQVARLMDHIESFNRILFIALLVGLAAAIASLFMAIWLTPSMFRPLEDIASVARQITKADDLSRRVPDTGRTDEIGDLAKALNQSLERLENLFRAQQRLLADVSHELRTPLTAIRGNVDLMRRMGEADPESLIIIQDEVERMTRLVSDLLLLARADSGGLPLHWRRIELDSLIFEVYRQVRVIPKDVDVVVTAVDPVLVWGDVDRVKQLILNLTDNAIKYTPVGGKVSLSLTKDHAFAYVSIRDTGIGIPKDDLPHIFDRFYRVDKARTRSMGGSGLGLSIAKWISVAHNGDILVESEIGEGTTFTIKLPILPTDVDATEDMQITRPSLRILSSALTNGK